MYNGNSQEWHLIPTWHFREDFLEEMKSRLSPEQEFTWQSGREEFFQVEVTTYTEARGENA